MVLPSNRTIADLNTLARILMTVGYIIISDYTNKIVEGLFSDLLYLQVYVPKQIQREGFCLSKERLSRITVYRLKWKNRIIPAQRGLVRKRLNSFYEYWLLLWQNL